MEITRLILSKIKSKERVINLTGKTNLIEIILLIKKACFVITHDTSIIHLSGLFNKKSICLSNGMHFKRFVPYPKNIFSECICLFPFTLSEENVNQYRFNSDLEIDKITPSQVIQAINKILD